MGKRIIGILMLSLLLNMDTTAEEIRADSLAAECPTDAEESTESEAGNEEQDAVHEKEAEWLNTDADEDGMVSLEACSAEINTTEEAYGERSWTLMDDSYVIPRTEAALNDFLEEHQTADAAEGQTEGDPDISAAEVDSSVRLNIEGSQFSAAISRTSYPYYRKMICLPTVHVYYGQTELVEGRDYTVNYSEITTDSGVGTYYIYIDGCNAYTGTIRKTYQITAQSLASATLQTTAMCYDLDPETEKKPAALVKAVANPVDGDLLTLLEGRDYTVTYKNNRIPGTATALVKGIDNYCGSQKLSFTITRVPLSELTISLSDTSYTCTGKELKPTVTVTGETDAGKKIVLKEGKTEDYTVGYRDNIVPGTAIVKVKAVSTSKYYSGSVTQSFRIRMSKTSLTSLTAGSGSFTAKWIKKTGGRADGYHLQFSMDSGFKNAVRRSVRSSSVTSWTEDGLKAGKTYYVRVRGYKKIGTKNYFSAWSQAMKVKIK